MVAADSEKPHVALLSSPGMGHIIPFLELARRLVTDHNFHVSFLVITTGASSAQHHLLSSAHTDDLQIIDLPPVDMSHIITDDMLLLTCISHIIDESLRSSLRSILIDLNRPKALIFDFFCTRATDICQELEIPVYSLITTSAAFAAFSLYMPKLDREVEGEFVDLPEPIQVPGCRPVRVRNLLEQAHNRKNDEYKWLLYHLSRFPKVAGILVNSWEDLEPVSIRAIEENQYYRDILIPPLYPVGPIIRQVEPMTKLQTDILKFLDKQPADSVLFVALGSGGTWSTQQLIELALGLELSHQRFILVARKPSDEGSWSTFFNVGDDKDDPVAYLPKGFVQRVDGVGLVVPEWAPQMAILSHESIGGFLSHCGWNSTLESISCGVPMIAWPMYAEQRMNAAMLEEEVGVAMWPLGTKEGKEVVERKEIAEVVKEMMEGNEGQKLRSRAREIKESAKKALDFDGLSSQALSRLVKIWKLDNTGVIISL